jgi:filamentous hemagglutinin family protein
MKKNLLSLIQASCLLVFSLNSTPLLAQEAAISEDGTTSTTVTKSDDNNFTVNDGDRAGGNLFHSFDNFSVPTGGSASFNNAEDVENIINRVTGGNVSDIDGLIKANGGANLFLINPAGIIFGENARLDIGGSFLGSTADSLIFPEGEFSVTDTQTKPILTVNAPIGLRLRDNPGNIINRSKVPDSTSQFLSGLEVKPEKNITLVGGNVDLESGKLTAPSGSVNLGGSIAAGTIGINDDASLNFPEGVARSNVSLSNTAFVAVGGDRGGSIVCCQC